MRPSCLDCTRKHLSKASLHLEDFPSTWEKLTGKEHAHFWLCIANLDEAEEETALEYLALTTFIRETIRLPMMQLLHGNVLPSAIQEINEKILLLLQRIDEDPSQFQVEAVLIKREPLAIHSPAFDIAKASILVKEAFTGYPTHTAMAIQLLQGVSCKCERINKLAIDLVIQDLMAGNPTNVFGLLDRFM